MSGNGNASEAGVRAGAGDKPLYAIRLKLTEEKAVPKMVLSLDGGGIRGYLAAFVAEEVENAIRTRITDKDGQWANKWECVKEVHKSDGTTTEEPVAEPRDADVQHAKIYLADFFHVICGTSTGSLLAAFFATKAGTASDVKLLFEKYGSRIFDNEGKDAKHSATGIDNSLREVLGTLSFADLLAGPSSSQWKESIKQTRDELFLPADWRPLPRGLFTNLGVTAYNVTQGRAAVFYATPNGRAGDGGRAGYAVVARSGGFVSAVKGDRDKATRMSEQPRTASVPTAMTTKEAGKAHAVKGDQEPMLKKLKTASVPTAMATKEAGKAHAEPDEGRSERGVTMYDDLALRLWDVVRCSTAAPSFFPPHELTVRKVTYTMMDGGVFANDPTLMALALANHLAATEGAPLPPPPATLSIGCGVALGNMPTDFPKWLANIAGFLGQDKKVSQVKAAELVAKILFGPLQESQAAAFASIMEDRYPGKMLRLQTYFFQDTAGAAPDGNHASSEFKEWVESIQKMDDGEPDNIKKLGEIAERALAVDGLDFKSKIANWVKANVQPL